MPLFQYKAVTATGEVLEGEMEARAQAGVVERLQSMGYIPIRAQEVVEKAQGGSRRLFGPRKIGQDQIGAITRELSTLLRAGLPLDRCMEILVNLSDNEAVRLMLAQIREQVRAGASLSQAMDAQKGVFSRFYLNMVRAGEAGGALDIVLLRLTEFMERAKELRETVKSALIYPAILVFVAVASILLLLLFVVPQFQQMFEESGRALPLPTQIVIGSGELLRDYWWAIVLAGVGVYTFMKRQMANPVSRLRWDRRILNLPLFGELSAKVEVASFARSLGTLIGNGVALLTALSVVKDTQKNTVIAQKLEFVASELKEGRGLSGPLMESGVFPKLAIHMVKVGEETGKLEEMLIRVADVYDVEVQRTVKRLLALMEPLLIVGLGLVVAGIIVSILVAILSINDLAV